MIQKKKKRPALGVRLPPHQRRGTRRTPWFLVQYLQRSNAIAGIPVYWAFKLSTSREWHLEAGVNDQCLMFPLSDGVDGVNGLLGVSCSVHACIDEPVAYQIGVVVKRMHVCQHKVETSSIPSDALFRFLLATMRSSSNCASCFRLRALRLCILRCAARALSPRSIGGMCLKRNSSVGKGE